MTLDELQPAVEATLTALEWATARARWRARLTEERAAIRRALETAEDVGVDPGPLASRLVHIDVELAGDVTADQVSVSPLRSVPMDLITAAVARRILRLPPDFPILSLKLAPTADQIREALSAIYVRWQTPNGQTPAEEYAAASQ